MKRRDMFLVFPLALAFNGALVFMIDVSIGVPWQYRRAGMYDGRFRYAPHPEMATTARGQGTKDGREGKRMRKREYLIAAPLAVLVSTSVAYTDMLICGVPGDVARIVASGAAIVGVMITFPLIGRAEEKKIVLKEEPVSHYDEEGHEHV